MFDEEESLIVSTKTEYDEVENVLRPKSMEGYVGQEKAKTNLSVFMQSAKLRGEPLDHVLLYGPPGLGKTTLAHIIAAEMGVQIKVTSGPSIEKSGDLAAILTNLNEGDVLFIDEIHRLNHNVEEILYPAMEDFSLDFIIGKGPSARSEIDELGLDNIDIRLLTSMIDKFGGGPVGLETLAATINEDSNTIEDVYEPYLLQLGFIQRSPRGRILMPKAYEHLGREVPRKLREQLSLFDLS